MADSVLANASEAGAAVGDAAEEDGEVTQDRCVRPQTIRGNKALKSQTTKSGVDTRFAVASIITLCSPTQPTTHASKNNKVNQTLYVARHLFIHPVPGCRSVRSLQ